MNKYRAWLHRVTFVGVLINIRLGPLPNGAARFQRPLLRQSPGGEALRV